MAALYFSSFLIPMNYLGLAWTRQSLRNQPPRFLLDRPWTAAFGKVVAYYFFWTLSLYTWPIIGIAIGGVLVYALSAGDEGFATFVSLIPLMWVCLASIGIIPFARLFLALRMIATERPASPLAAWRLGAGLGLRLGCALFLLTITLLVSAALGLAIMTAAAEALLRLTVVDAVLQDMIYVRSWISSLLAFGIVVPIGSVMGTALFAETLVMAFCELADWDGRHPTALRLRLTPRRPRR